MKEMLKLYTSLTNNALVKRTIDDVTKEVNDAVKNAQQQADHIVNALTKSDPDHGTAAQNLAKLLDAPGLIRDHWKPFLDEAAKLLPDELRPDLGRVAIPLDGGPSVPKAEYDSAVKQLNEALAKNDRLVAERDEMAAKVAAGGGVVETMSNDLSRVLTGSVDAGTKYTGIVGEVQASIDTLKKRAAGLEAELEALKKKSKK